MSVHFGELARRVGDRGSISSEDILALRRDVWPDGRIGQDEAEAIFALNRQFAAPSAEWCDFLVEAIGEYVINQRAPLGYVDEENAAWLIGQIDSDGKLETTAELELLVRVFERARNVPPSLKDYALRQIELAVLEGEGPTRDGGAFEAGSVNATEAKLLRRVIFAPAGDGPASVGASEAAMLFRLKDASLGKANAPEWKQLFVQGVGNFLCGFSSGHAQLTRERAAELEAFVGDTQPDVGRFFRRMASAASDFGSRYGQLLGDDVPERPSRELRVAEASRVTGGEQGWLDSKIGADGQVDEYETALLDFLASE